MQFPTPDAENPLRDSLLSPLSRERAQVFTHSARATSPRSLRFGLRFIAQLGLKMYIPRRSRQGRSGATALNNHFSDWRNCQKYWNILRIKNLNPLKRVHKNWSPVLT
jgi:hypothetical protein